MSRPFLIPLIVLMAALFILAAVLLVQSAITSNSPNVGVIFLLALGLAAGGVLLWTIATGLSLLADIRDAVRGLAPALMPDTVSRRRAGSEVRPTEAAVVGTGRLRDGREFNRYADGTVSLRTLSGADRWFESEADLRDYVG